MKCHLLDGAYCLTCPCVSQCRAYLQSTIAMSAHLLRAAKISAGCYTKFQDLMKLERQVDCNQPITWSMFPLPIHLENWSRLLLAHPDQTFASYIQSGLSSGLLIGFNSQCCKLHSSTRNHPLAPHTFRCSETTFSQRSRPGNWLDHCASPSN